MGKNLRLSQTVTYGLCSVLVLIGLANIPKLSATTQGITEEVPITIDGNPPNGDSSGLKISSDGRYIYFSSYATNLVANDTNSTSDLFVRDRLTNITSLLSINSAGQQANNVVYGFDISDGGRYIVFSSPATNLVTPDYNSGSDIYLRDTVTSQTSLIFRNPYTGQSANDPVISGDGNWIAFTTQQSFSPYFDTAPNVYLINRQTQALTRISNSTGGGNANASSSRPDINYDGKVISFNSSASNLVNGDTNGQSDVFVWQKGTGSISRVSVSSSGVQANNYSQSSHISGNGNRIVFDSYATNLVPNATTFGKFKVLLHEIDTGTTTLINQTPAGVESNDQAWNKDISKNGNLVSFNSSASNLVGSDTNGTMDYFVRDLESNTTTLVSLDNNGNQYTNSAYGTAISAEGQYILFNVSNYQGDLTLFRY